jgi:hypothetical protein
LPQIIHATDALTPFLRLREGRKQHGGENGDDGDYNKQLDESEGNPSLHG